MNDGRELGFPVLDPIVPGQAAHPPGARYRLVAGRDLLEAYELIGLLNFSARLSPVPMGERSVRVMNIREAIRLGTLDEYERAHAFERLRGCGLAQADIVAAFEGDGCGLTTVKESLFTYENLISAALEAWRTDRIRIAPLVRWRVAVLMSSWMCWRVGSTTSLPASWRTK